MKPPRELVLGLRPFLPAKDFEGSLQFYRALGFDEVWTSPSLVLFDAFGFGFFVQRYHVQEWAENMMLDLRVADEQSEKADSGRESKSIHIFPSNFTSFVGPWRTRT